MIGLQNSTCPHCRVQVPSAKPFIPNIIVDQIIERKLKALPDSDEKQEMMIELKEKLEYALFLLGKQSSSENELNCDNRQWKIIQIANPPPKPNPPKRGRSFEDFINLVVPAANVDRQDRHHRRASGHVHELGPPIPVPANPRSRSSYANMSLADIHRLHAEEDALNTDAALAEIRRLRTITQRQRVVLAAIADSDGLDIPRTGSPTPLDHVTRNRRERLSSITENRVQGLGPALERGMGLQDNTHHSSSSRVIQPPVVLGNRIDLNRGQGQNRPNVLASRQARGRERVGTRESPVILSDSE